MNNHNNLLFQNKKLVEKKEEPEKQIKEKVSKNIKKAVKTVKN
jgi:hypothetical protein